MSVTLRSKAQLPIAPPIGPIRYEIVVSPETRGLWDVRDMRSGEILTKAVQKQVAGAIAHLLNGHTTQARSELGMLGVEYDAGVILTSQDVALFGDGDPVRGAREIRLMITNERERAISEGPVPRSASPSVRRATAADEDGIYELLKIDVAENAEAVAPANEECIRETIKAALIPPSEVGVIDGPNGKIIGVVMLQCMRWWWSKAWYYQEIPLFVHPDHRKSTHAKQLLAFQQWWVDEMARGAGYRIYLLCGVLGVNRVRAKMMMYRRKFRQVGAAYLYPAPPMKGG